MKGGTKSAAAEVDGPPLLGLPPNARGRPNPTPVKPPPLVKGLPQASDSTSLDTTLGRTTTGMGSDFLKQTLARTATSTEPDFLRQTLARTPTDAPGGLMRQTLRRADTNTLPDFLRQTLARTATNMGSGLFGRTLGRAATGVLRSPQMLLGTAHSGCLSGGPFGFPTGNCQIACLSGIVYWGLAVRKCPAGKSPLGSACCIFRDCSPPSVCNDPN